MEKKKHMKIQMEKIHKKDMEWMKSFHILYSCITLQTLSNSKEKN